MKLYAIAASSSNQFWWGTLEPETTSKNTVMELLEGDGWLNSKSWITSAVNGTRKLHRGVDFICNDGYLCWTCLINPQKDRIPASPTMQ